MGPKGLNQHGWAMPNLPGMPFTPGIPNLPGIAVLVHGSAGAELQSAMVCGSTRER